MGKFTALKKAGARTRKRANKLAIRSSPCPKKSQEDGGQSPPAGKRKHRQLSIVMSRQRQRHDSITKLENGAIKNRARSPGFDRICMMDLWLSPSQRAIRSGAVHSAPQGALMTLLATISVGPDPSSNYSRTRGSSSFFLHSCRPAQEAAQSCCRACGGKLHRADYPRKARGVPHKLMEQWDRRYSFCSSTEGCRLRHTPVSVRFLGRKVYDRGRL